MSGGNMGSLAMDMDGMMKKMMADMSMGGPGAGMTGMAEMPSLASKMGATDMGKVRRYVQRWQKRNVNCC